MGNSSSGDSGGDSGSGDSGDSGGGDGVCDDLCGTTDHDEAEVNNGEVEASGIQTATEKEKESDSGDSGNHNWEGNYPETYPSSTCHEGHGGSHCSHGDIMSGTNAMNNIDDAGDIPGAAVACLFGGDAPYHAAAENIKGPCPNPEAHGEKNDMKK